MVVEAEDNVQIDLIVGMNAVLTLPEFEDLTIDTSPIMCLPKSVNLCRLLAEWTNMTNQQIRDTAHVEASMVGDELEDVGRGSFGSGASDTDLSSSDDESATDVPNLGDRSKASRRTGTKHRRWTNNRVAFNNRADSHQPRAAGQGRFSGRLAADIGTVRTLDDDGSLDDWMPGQRWPAAQSSVKHNLSQRLNRSVPGSRKQAKSQYPSRSQYQEATHQQIPPPIGMPSYYYPGPVPQQPPGPGLHSSQTTGYPARPAQTCSTWPALAPPAPPPPQTSPYVRGLAGKQKQSAAASSVEDVASEDLRATNISMRSSQISVIGNGERVSNKYEGPRQKGTKAAPTTDRSNGVTPDVDDVKEKEEFRARIKKELRAEIMTELTQERLLAVQIYQDKHREQLEAYTSTLTYDEMYQQAYHDLKQKQAEEDERVQSLRQKIREEIKMELKEGERRNREEEELKGQVRQRAEREENLRKEIGEQQHMETMRQKIFEEVMTEVEGRESRARQKEELAERLVMKPTESSKGDQVSPCDVFSFIDEDLSTSEGVSEIISEAEDDNQTKTVTSDMTQLYPNTERSQPWKGISHLGSCSGLVPFYIRGSNAGQTWYHGDDLIYIVEFTEGYNGEDEEVIFFNNKRPYLLVDKLWVEAEALEKFGFRYRECPPSYFFLDPSLTCDDIQVLVDFSFELREISNFKNHGLSHSLDAPTVSGVPPPLDFFGAVAKDEDSAPVPPRQPISSGDSIHGGPTQAFAESGRDEAPEELLADAFLVESSEDDADEDEGDHSPAASKGFAYSVLFIFGVLRFALRSIM